MHECANTQLQNYTKYTIRHMHEYTNTQTCECQHTGIHTYSSTQDIQIHKCTDTQNTQMHKHASTQRHIYTNTQIHT